MSSIGITEWLKENAKAFNHSCVLPSSGTIISAMTCAEAMSDCILCGRRSYCVKPKEISSCPWCGSPSVGSYDGFVQVKGVEQKRYECGSFIGICSSLGGLIVTSYGMGPSCMFST